MTEVTVEILWRDRNPIEIDCKKTEAKYVIDHKNGVGRAMYWEHQTTNQRKISLTLGLAQKKTFYEIAIIIGKGEVMTVARSIGIEMSKTDTVQDEWENHGNDSIYLLVGFNGWQKFESFSLEEFSDWNYWKKRIAFIFTPLIITLLTNLCAITEPVEYAGNLRLILWYAITSCSIIYFYVIWSLDEISVCMYMCVSARAN